MGSFLFNNRKFIYCTTFCLMFFISLSAFFGNKSSLNDKLKNYYEIGFGAFCFLFILSYFGVFSKNYNIFKHPSLLKINSTFFFLSGVTVLIGSIAYIIYMKNIIIIPEYVFGSCGAITGAVLQSEDIIESSCIRSEKGKGSSEILDTHSLNGHVSHKKIPETIFNIALLILILALFVGLFTLIEWFYPNLFDIIRFD